MLFVPIQFASAVKLAYKQDLVFPGLLSLSLEAEVLWGLGILSYFLIRNSELIFQQILCLL